jgi:hypothetical protein
MEKPSRSVIVHEIFMGIWEFYGMNGGKNGDIHGIFIGIMEYEFRCFLGKPWWLSGI